MLGRPARERTSVLGTLSCQVKDSPKAGQVEGVEFPFMLGVGDPSFTAVQLCIANVSFLHCHLCHRRELRVLPDACGKASKHRCSLPNTSVLLYGQRQVVRDG